MRNVLNVTDVSLAVAPTRLQDRGMCGWITCVLGGRLRLTNIALRRTSNGRLVLSFPGREDIRGHRHAYALPVDAEGRAALRDQIFEALRKQGWLDP